MLSHHSVIWIDHFEAHIIHFDVDSSQQGTVNSQPTHLHMRLDSAGNNGAADNARFFNKIIDA